MERLICDICASKKIESKIKGRSRNEIISNMLKHIKENHFAHYENFISLSREKREIIFNEQRNKINYN